MDQPEGGESPQWQRLRAKAKNLSLLRDLEAIRERIEALLEGEDIKKEEEGGNEGEPDSSQR